MVFGDVLSILSLVVGIPFTTWAMVLACRFVFPVASERASVRLKSAPVLAFFVGLVVALFFGFVGIVEINIPAPPVKVLGFVTLSSLFAVSTLGCAGISQIAAERIRLANPNIDGYASYVRGAGFVIVACMSPLVGWLFIGPIAVITSIGAGVIALLARKEAAVNAA